MNNNFEIIFFDLGNVLVNVNIEMFFANLAIMTGSCMMDVYAVADSHADTIEQFNKGLISANQFYNTVTSSYNNITFEQFSDAYTDIFTLNAPIVPVVNLLQKSEKLSIISNTDILHFEYIKKKFNFINNFENPITSYEVHSLKPEPEIYLNAMNQFKMQPKHCIFIDDKKENITAANDLGMTGIHFTGVNRLVDSLIDLGFTNLKTLEV